MIYIYIWSTFIQLDFAFPYFFNWVTALDLCTKCVSPKYLPNKWLHYETILLVLSKFKMHTKKWAQLRGILVAKAFICNCMGTSIDSWISRKYWIVRDNIWFMRPWDVKVVHMTKMVATLMFGTSRKELITNRPITFKLGIVLKRCHVYSSYYPGIVWKLTFQPSFLYTCMKNA